MSDIPPLPHAKKKYRKPEPEVDPEFRIAPMIDILLVLLVFFMSISSTEVLQANRDVNLPIAKDAKEAKDNPGQIIVNVTFVPVNDLTSIEVDQIRYTSPVELIPLLVNKVTANPLVRVLIRSDKEVKYEYTRQLLKAIGQAGVNNVTFSVVDKDAKTANPS